MAEVALDIAIAAEHSPNTSSFVTIQLLGGAAAEPHANATAVAHRHARHLVTIVGKWNAHHEKHPVCAWVGELYHQLCIHSMDGVHEPVLPAPLHQPSTHKPEDGEQLHQPSTHTPEDGEQEPVFVSSFGCNHDDLVDLKRKYDPGNVFHMNDNIDPNPQPAF
ncbi:hypothetical protein T484DRAFT_1812904 [Baffinella frigidus]|nr:hypothetical protein T484DRAFT_1812904 [Cryptophyta sp. CCMP2293]